MSEDIRQSEAGESVEVWLPHRVSYGETDAMGVVYHAEYIHFFERSRGELCRVNGLGYNDVEAAGFMLPVKEVECRYRIPARYDDLLTIKVKMHELKGARLRFDHEIHNQEGQLVNTGFVELVFVNATTRRPCHAPEWFANLFATE